MASVGWSLNPESVGALATAAATVVALCLALKGWIAATAERRLRVKIAARLLDTELEQLRTALHEFEYRCKHEFRFSLTGEQRERLMLALKVPALVAYIENATSLPDSVALEMANVLAIARGYENSLLAKSPIHQICASEPHWAPVQGLPPINAAVKNLKKCLVDEA